MTKVLRKNEIREVIYSKKHWELLKRKRAEALEIMNVLEKCNLESIVHGSVARGDVNEDSDVDVVIPYPVAPFKVKQCLDVHSVKVFNEIIIMATPRSTPKALIALDESELKLITFPLASLTSKEYEFYKFSGYLKKEQLLKNVRVPGVNKNLLLIRPTGRGHLEMSIIGREHYVANLLNVSIDLVKERVSMLTRRDEIGRTGIYLKYFLGPSETFEEAIRNLIKSNKFFRKFFV